MQGFERLARLTNVQPEPPIRARQRMPEWFFSAPYEAPMVRRGDPLGLRLAAARYAEALAPGLTNRTLDARWLTIGTAHRSVVEPIDDHHAGRLGISACSWPDARRPVSKSRA
jgi:hypothetical protein